MRDKPIGEARVSHARLAEIHRAALSHPDGVAGEVVMGSRADCQVVTADELREVTRLALEYAESWPAGT